MSQNNEPICASEDSLLKLWRVSGHKNKRLVWLFYSKIFIFKLHQTAKILSTSTSPHLPTNASKIWQLCGKNGPRIGTLSIPLYSFLLMFLYFFGNNWEYKLTFTELRILKWEISTFTKKKKYCAVQFYHKKQRNVKAISFCICIKKKQQLFCRVTFVSSIKFNHSCMWNETQDGFI